MISRSGRSMKAAVATQPTGFGAGLRVGDHLRGDQTDQRRHHQRPAVQAERPPTTRARRNTAPSLIRSQVASSTAPKPGAAAAFLAPIAPSTRSNKTKERDHQGAGEQLASGIQRQGRQHRGGSGDDGDPVGGAAGMQKTPRATGFGDSGYFPRGTTACSRLPVPLGGQQTAGCRAATAGSPWNRR